MLAPCVKNISRGMKNELSTVWMGPLFRMSSNGGRRMISKLIARLQRVNLSYWFANCKCDCKSCFEMRKSIVALQEEEE